MSSHQSIATLLFLKSGSSEYQLTNLPLGLYGLCVFFSKAVPLGQQEQAIQKATAFDT